MTLDFVVLIMREALQTVLLLCVPILISSLIIGMSVGFLQAVTQLQDQTLTFIPKILGAGAALFVFGPWMLGVGMRFAHHCVEIASRVGH